MTAADAQLDRTFQALADPTRRALVTALLTGDRTVSDLAAPHDMSLAAVSKHIATLVRAGVVSQRREGRVRICRLEIETLRPAALWLSATGLVDPLDLDLLEGRLEDLGLLDAP
ncbi:MAG: metalloregulator ArsR/SmtB family transcription factor [Pseudomonadota bacterium]